MAGARKAFGQGFWLSTYLILAVSALIFIFAPQIALMLGATPDLVDGVVTFMRIFVCFYPFCILGQMMVVGAARRRETGAGPPAAMFGSAVLAIVWLYCSIFLANMGVAGAAVYYGLSIGLWFVAVFYFVFSKHTKFKIAFSDMKLEGKLCKEILTIGLPTFLVQAAQPSVHHRHQQLSGRAGRRSGDRRLRHPERLPGVHPQHDVAVLHLRRAAPGLA